MTDTNKGFQARLMASVVHEHQQTPHAGMNPARLRIHAAVHAVVETQIAQGTPAETTLTLKRLMDQGISRHDAVHAIGAVVSTQLINTLGSEGGYDEQQYARQLRELSAQDPRTIP